MQKAKTNLHLVSYFLIIASLCLLVQGCSEKAPPIPAPLRTEPMPLQNAALGAGDEISIAFRYWPELGTINQKIRLDGNISLPHVGVIQAEGLTPEQLTARLTEKYKDILRNPEITITIQTVTSKRVYVGGEVWSPKVLELNANMSVLEAIIAAGGFRKESAELSNILVIRHYGKNRYVSTIDLTKVLNGEVSDPFYLAANDIIFIPRTKIDQLDQWIEQHLTKIISVSGFGVSLYPADDYNIFIGGAK